MSFPTQPRALSRGLFPALYASQTAEGAAPRWQQVAARIAQRELPAAETGTVPAPSVAADCARCPDLVLDELLSLLDPADLARAGRVCRRWYQIACRPGIRMSSLRSHCPPWHREKLARLDIRLSRQLLALWSEACATGSAQRAALDWPLQSPPSAQDLFHWMTQALLRAPTLVAEKNDKDIDYQYHHRRETLYSPDGRYMVVEEVVDRGAPLAISLWRQEATTQVKLDRYPLGENRSGLYGLGFSPDSGQLLLLEASGLLRSWQRQTDDSWEAAVSIPLSPDPVSMARFSPDARSLVVQSDEHVRLFAKTGGQGWELHCDLQWTDRLDPGRASVPAAEIMHFNDDSRHCLFVNGRRAFVFGCDQGHWQGQEVRKAASPSCYQDAGALAPRGRWLALAADAVVERPFNALGYRLELWRPDDKRQWQRVFDRLYASTGFGLPLCFSPDGQQLAWAYRSDNNAPWIGVLTCSAAGAWEQTARLRFDWDPEDFLGSAAHSLNYSPQGQYLAAVSWGGVQLWRCDGDAFPSVARITNDDYTQYVLFDFSPDGYHCAVGCGQRGEVSLLGPGAGGRLVIKVRSIHGPRLNQLLFAPCGSLLMVSRQPRSDFAGSRARFLRLRPLWCRPEPVTGPQRAAECGVPVAAMDQP